MDKIKEQVEDSKSKLEGANEQVNKRLQYWATTWRQWDGPQWKMWKMVQKSCRMGMSMGTTC
eukprot:3770602-Heterocapsa_arctica.AAC.1